MSWRAIARKDVSDAIRSRVLWLLLGVFLVVFLGLAYAVPKLADEEFDTFLAVSTAVVGLLVPLLAVVVGYKAVIDERTSGSMAILLSLPHSRRDVAVGKFLGRGVVLSGPIVLALLLAVPIVLLRYATFEPVTYLGFVVATVVFGLSFLGIAVGLSMATTASRRVVAGAFGAYIVFVMLWAGLVDFLVLVLFRFQENPLSDPPTWAVFAKLAEPTTAYQYVLAEGVEAGTPSPVDALGPQWFASPIVGLALLLAWILVPMTVGYWRFERADL